MINSKKNISHISTFIIFFFYLAALCGYNSNRANPQNMIQESKMVKKLNAEESTHFKIIKRKLFWQ
jgi:hypothetical protein